MNLFMHTNYLKDGNARQKSAFKIIEYLNIMKDLELFNPLLAGTIPIDMDVENSDLDILCDRTNISGIKMYHCEF
nr:DUF4269 domain-containing protein [Chengkuizengella marina]